MDARAQRAEAEAVRALPHVRLLDVNDRICAATTCEAVRQGVVVYLDDNHLTDAFVRGLSPAIDSAVATLRLLPPKD